MSLINTPEAAKSHRLRSMCGWDPANEKWVGVEVRSGGADLVTIDHLSASIIKGTGFTCSYSNTTTNIGEMTGIAFNTPDSTTRIHAYVSISSSAGSRFGIYRDTSLDNGEGTQLTIYNLDGNSATVSTVTSIEATPVANKATSWNETQMTGANLTKTYEILPVELGVGGGPFQQGGLAATIPIVLEKGTQYAYVLTANTANADIHNITIVWDEHIP